MSESNRLSGIDRAWEETLRQLQPASSPVNTDQMLFRAGAAWGRRARRPWQALATACVLVMACSLFMHLSAPARPEVREMAQKTSSSGSLLPNPVVIETAKEKARYLRLRHAVMEQGVDVLPVLRRSRDEGCRVIEGVLRQPEDSPI